MCGVRCAACCSLCVRAAPEMKIKIKNNYMCRGEIFFPRARTPRIYAHSFALFVRSVCLLKMTKKCKIDGCTTLSQGGGKKNLCQRHGGGSRCREPDCNNGVQSGGKKGMCKRHGGGYRCVAMGLFKALLPIMTEDLLWAVEIPREPGTRLR